MVKKHMPRGNVLLSNHMIVMTLLVTDARTLGKGIGIGMIAVITMISTMINGMVPVCVGNASEVGLQRPFMLQMILC